ncbi:MAG: type II secretion system F family protein [Planctomycetota bacterium]|nr:MAG: type II secretion system F family protein [Planctomycetota bacterium]
MSVLESSLLGQKQPSVHKAAENNNCAVTVTKIYQPDVFRRISTKNLCRLARQLATLLHAGMPLVPALSALVEQLRNEPLAGVLEHVADAVNQGTSLADALKEHPDIFSPLFVNMVAAGQATGTLEEVLLRLAEILEKRLLLAGKVKVALAYPLMMLAVATAVVIFLLSYVVPSITQIFLEMNRSLPWPTRFLISASAFLKTYFLLIVILICALFCAIAAAYRTTEARVILDRSKLKLPLFGKLFLKLEIARLARTLGILLISGLPILSALETARGVVQNSFIANAIDYVKNLISKGDNIAGAIRKTRLFPPIVLHIIATGQASGTLEDGLISIADMYDGEVETAAKTLTSILEPAIILVMGVVVGFIVLAILLPIFEINNVL